MVDVFTSYKRSMIMSRIRGGNTEPEKAVRRIIHRMGYRFRLHVSELPGKPDIVLPRHKKIIFVNGCFWHGHARCIRSKRPVTNPDFWNKKIDANMKRDKKVRKELSSIGWSVLTIWQCQIQDMSKLGQRLKNFMEKE